MLTQSGYGKVSFKKGIYLLHIQSSFWEKNENNQVPTLIRVIKSIFVLGPAGLV